MTLWLITFKDGSTMQEYGDDEEDVQEFLNRCYPLKGWAKTITVIS